jgi:cytidylate kinase
MFFHKNASAARHDKAGADHVEFLRNLNTPGGKEDLRKMPLITISGGVGTGAGRIAQFVAKKSRVELFDDLRLQQEANKMGIRADDLKGLNEKAPSFFDSLRYNPELYLDILESVVYQVSRGGEGVIVGHGSQLLLRDFGCAMHVFIHASEAYRIQQLMERYHLADKAAGKMIRRSDNEKKGFLRFAFQMDWENPSLYDLVINTEKLGIDGAAKLIMESLLLDEIKECSLRALETMERMSLIKRVQASLLKDGFSYSQFNVDVPEQGLVQVTGYAATEEDKGRMLKVIRNIPGVTEIKDEVGIMPVGAY